MEEEAKQKQPTVELAKLSDEEINQYQSNQNQSANLEQMPKLTEQLPDYVEDTYDIPPLLDFPDANTKPLAEDITDSEVDDVVPTEHEITQMNTESNELATGAEVEVETETEQQVKTETEQSAESQAQEQAPAEMETQDESAQPGTSHQDEPKETGQ